MRVWDMVVQQSNPKKGKGLDPPAAIYKFM